MSSLGDYAKTFNSLSDEFRLNVLLFLYENGEKCVCDICDEFNISQSSISYHLKILCEADIINKRKVAVWNYYLLNDKSDMYDLLICMFCNINKKEGIYNA